MSCVDVQACDVVPSYDFVDEVMLIKLRAGLFKAAISYPGIRANLEFKTTRLQISFQQILFSLRFDLNCSLIIH